MSMRLVFFRILWLLLGAAIVVALLETALRLLPVSMGIYRTDQFERWPLQNSEAHVPYAYSLTWAMLNAHRGTTNNYGHIAPFDYKKGSGPILVLGDSYIESLMNAHADTLQGQLGKRVGPSLPVYGLGASGLSASDYVAVSRMAKDEFSPVAAVVLMVDGDFSESLGPHVGYHYLVPDGEALKPGYAPLRGESTAKRIRKLIGDISIYRYLQVNLQFSPENVVNVFAPNPPVKAATVRPAENIETQRKVADWFLAELPASLGLPPECIVFLMDSDRYAIYKPESASRPKDNPQVRQYFIEHAQALGFNISDLDPVFGQAYARDGAKFDYWPIDRHWNRLGHGVAADETFRLLFSQGSQQKSSCLPVHKIGK
jgi:hypothetical protein